MCQKKEENNTKQRHVEHWFERPGGHPRKFEKKVSD